jgi:hypothetical protein
MEVGRRIPKLASTVELAIPEEEIPENPGILRMTDTERTIWRNQVSPSLSLATLISDIPLTPDAVHSLITDCGRSNHGYDACRAGLSPERAI